MGFVELIVLAVGLSMDACAVAICKGACMRRTDMKQRTMIAVSFGLFQGVMPLIGWALARQFAASIHRFDHWIAFILLAVLGGKMLWDAMHMQEETVCEPLKLQELLLLSLATSIDALAAGVALGMLEVNIVFSVSLIALITCALSFLGTVIGNRFGQKYENKAQYVGGATLCLMGLKILIEHLGAA